EEITFIGMCIYRFRKDGRWPGQIVRTYGDELETFIWFPPEALRKTKHWACFNPVKPNQYRVHFLERVTNVSQAILNVQRLLAEAIIFHSDKKEARK
ncbi:MAG: hypothetical protein KJ621_10885, partial [Proteobacteria bacterium]|nr:hypothetical protein [Pseudomonadota bacterium]